MASCDILTLTGRGGLYNGEAYAIEAGRSATAGASSIATFPVTRSRIYLRLTEAAGPPATLRRLAPEHLRLVYVDEGRLHVENLAGRDVRVGGRMVQDTIEVDLLAGPVEIEFGYGERMLAATSGSPAGLQTLGERPSGTEEVRRAFLALLRPDHSIPEGEDLDPPLALYPEDPPPARPPPPPPGPPERPEPAGAAGQSPGHEGQTGERRRGARSATPAVFLSGLVHLVLVLGLFTWISGSLLPVPREDVAEVKVAAPRTRNTSPEPSPPVGDPIEPDRPTPVEPAHLLDSELASSGPETVMPESGAEALGTAGPAVGGIMGIGTGGGGVPGSGGSFRPGGGAGGGGQGTGAVALGLDWLARHQREDGAWGGISSLVDCTMCADRGRREYRVALTGLALLAFVGAGNTQRDSAYAGEVRSATRWLLDRMDETGAFHPAETPAERQPMYGQAMAVLSLAELFRVSKSPLLRRPVERGLRYIERTQNAYAGWRYVPGEETSDTSVTGWQVLAHVAAKRAGIPANPVLAYGVMIWLEEMTDPVTWRVGYRRRGRGSPGMTATALATRLLFGAARGEPAVRGARDILAQTLPKPPVGEGSNPVANPPDLLYWYFGTIAMRNLGGDAWRSWRESLVRTLTSLQERNGEAAGSWRPMFDWDRTGGTVMSTALAILCLEIAAGYEEAFR